MSRWMGWLSRNGSTLLVGAACFLVGVGMSLPLGWKLSDPVLTLFGSVAGVVGTVGGAILLWRMQADREGAVLRERIIYQLELAIEDIDRCSGGSSEPEPARKIEGALELLSSTLESLRQILSSSLGRLHLLPEDRPALIARADAIARSLTIYCFQVKEVGPERRKEDAADIAAVFQRARGAFVLIVQELRAE